MRWEGTHFPCLDVLKIKVWESGMYISSLYLDIVGGKDKWHEHIN